MTTTGVLGPASLMRLPVSSTSARTLPNAEPATRLSPTRKVPFWTTRVAMAPRPRSRCESMTVPTARPLGSAFGSTRMSETVSTLSSRSSMPSPVLALVLTTGTSPP